MFVPIPPLPEAPPGAVSRLLCGRGDDPAVLPANWLGRCQCVYLDPPFMTGERFQRRRPLGESDWRQGRMSLTLPAYADRFDTPAAYDALLRGLIVNAAALLADTGFLYLHLDWRASARARLLCDEVLGADRFLNEIIWSYESGGRATRHFSRKHDTILLYAGGRHPRFDITRVPLDRTVARSNHMKRQVDEDGRAYRSIRSGGKEYRYYDDTPVYPGDVWTDISHLQQRDPERTGYATQKPVKLLDRLLRPCVLPGERVCDLCCGSGTTLAAAQALGCDFLGVDESPAALAVARGRLTPGTFRFDCPSPADAAALTGTVSPTGVTLTGYDVPGLPQGAHPLDGVEQWTVGRITADGFVPAQALRRSFAAPVLIPHCPLPDGEGDIAVAVVDAWGGWRMFRWNP